jgi:hypothetical protein
MNRPFFINTLILLATVIQGFAAEAKVQITRSVVRGSQAQSGGFDLSKITLAPRMTKPGPTATRPATLNAVAPRATTRLTPSQYLLLRPHLAKILGVAEAAIAAQPTPATKLLAPGNSALIVPGITAPEGFEWDGFSVDVRAGNLTSVAGASSSMQFAAKNLSAGSYMFIVHSAVAITAPMKYALDDLNINSNTWTSARGVATSPQQGGNLLIIPFQKEQGGTSVIVLTLFCEPSTRLVCTDVELMMLK